MLSTSLRFSQKEDTVTSLSSSLVDGIKAKNPLALQNFFKIVTNDGVLYKKYHLPLYDLCDWESVAKIAFFEGLSQTNFDDPWLAVHFLRKWVRNACSREISKSRAQKRDHRKDISIDEFQDNPDQKNLDSQMVDCSDFFLSPYANYLDFEDAIYRVEFYLFRIIDKKYSGRSEILKKIYTFKKEESNLSYNEIGDILGIAYSTVSTYIAILRQLIKEIFSNLLYLRSTDNIGGNMSEITKETIEQILKTQGPEALRTLLVESGASASEVASLSGDALVDRMFQAVLSENDSTKVSETPKVSVSPASSVTTMRTTPVGTPIESVSTSAPIEPTSAVPRTSSNSRIEPVSSRFSNTSTFGKACDFVIENIPNRLTITERKSYIAISDGNSRLFNVRKAKNVFYFRAKEEFIDRVKGIDGVKIFDKELLAKGHSGNLPIELKTRDSSIALEFITAIIS